MNAMLHCFESKVDDISVEAVCEWKEVQGMPTRGGDYGKDI